MDEGSHIYLFVIDKDKRTRRTGGLVSFSPAKLTIHGILKSRSRQITEPKKQVKSLSKKEWSSGIGNFSINTVVCSCVLLRNRYRKKEI